MFHLLVKNVSFVVFICLFPKQIGKPMIPFIESHGRPQIERQCNDAFEMAVLVGTIKSAFKIDGADESYVSKSYRID